MSNGKAAARVYLIEAAPMSKSSSRTLSYFSTEKLSPGTFVKIPLKKRTAYGVVIGSRSVRDAKSEVRKAGFALKKIAKRDVSTSGISPELLDAIKICSLYYAADIGALAAALLPKAALENPENFFPPAAGKRSEISKKPLDSARGKETLVLQMETEERFGQYRAMVRQSFARRKSVLFIVPTNFEVKKAEKLLSAGIEPYVYKLKGISGKNDWPRALSDPHPVLLIATPSGAAFDRPDIDTIILERENSRAYRMLSRPYINYKVFFEMLAGASSRQLVLGDSVLSIETLEKERRGDYSELSLVRWRLPAVPTTLVDASHKPDGNGKFRIFTPELISLVRKAMEEKARIFLFGVRKGLAPATVCGDCGYLLPCLNCGAPVVLHRQKSEGNIYICHACGTKRESSTVCGYCGSWKLVPLGIGIERIAAEARDLFHGASVEILDKDHAPSDARARSVAQKFEKNGAILVGTELAFYHIEKVPYSALVSADSLFSIPDFAINERIFYLISKLREMAERETLVQTRNIGKQVISWAAQGNIIDFYISEINERKELSYPPFSIFIKIEKFRNSNFEIRTLAERLSKWHPDIYKDSIIMRIPKNEWPNAELSKIISLLGREFSVKVDPESIL